MALQAMAGKHNSSTNSPVYHDLSPNPSWVQQLFGIYIRRRSTISALTAPSFRAFSLIASKSSRGRGVRAQVAVGVNSGRSHYLLDRHRQLESRQYQNRESKHQLKEILTESDDLVALIDEPFHCAFWVSRSTRGGIGGNRRRLTDNAGVETTAEGDTDLSFAHFLWCGTINGEN